MALFDVLKNTKCQMNRVVGLFLAVLLCLLSCSAFNVGRSSGMLSSIIRSNHVGSVNRATIKQKPFTLQKSSSLQMNFFEDAFRYFSQLNKEASAKHILIKVIDFYTYLYSVQQQQQYHFLLGSLHFITHSFFYHFMF